MAKKIAPRVDLNKLSIDAIVTSLNLKYGANTLIKASVALAANISYISTGIYGYDFATAGGLPRNRITEIRGPYSAGKSTLSLCSIRQFQIDFPSGIPVIIDLEKAFDPKYAKLLGIDLEKLILVNPDSGEQAVDVINALMEVTVDLFMVMDSLAALVPTAEIEDSMDQQHMGLQARLVNRAFRVFTSRMKRGMYSTAAPTTTLLVLNQLREKIGVMFGSPETTPGGKGKDFFYSVRARISAPPSERILEKIKHNGVERSILKGHCHNVTVDKNKCGGGQFNEAEYSYFVKEHKHYGRFEFNNDEVAFAMGLFYDIIEPVVKGGKLVKHVVGNGTELPARESLAISTLHGKPKTMRYIYRKVLEALRDDKVKQSDAELTDDDDDAAVGAVVKG